MKREDILTLLFLLSAFLLALCHIQDTDTWQHLSFGRLIWQLKGLPATEPFQYTMKGQPFSYTSWFFALVYYIAYRTFDIYGVILLKAGTITAAFYILLADSLMPYRSHIVSIIVMTIVVIISQHRFVERPDTFLMLFLSFSIFSLNAFVYNDKKYIYTLPFIHLLWANSHSSINLMVVPFLSFIAGGLLQRYLSKRGMAFSNTPSYSQLKIITAIFILSVAVSLLNPNFFGQYTWGIKVLATPWFKQNIAEAFAPTWKTVKWPYLITAAVLFSFIIPCLAAFLRRGSRMPSIIDFLMVIPFVILAFTAIRFIFLLAIVAGPVLIRNLSAYLDVERLKRFSLKNGMFSLVAIWLILYTSFSLFKVYPFGDNARKFGFGIDYSFVPEGALKYMDKKEIAGRIFNIFQWGSYIVWRDFPNRSIFIDPRGYLPPDLLEKSGSAFDNPTIMSELKERYGFESVLTIYPWWEVGKSSHEVVDVFPNPQWALVYWDDLSLLYLKKGGKYDSIIQEDEYRIVKPSNGIDRSSLQDEKFRLNLIKELKRNIEATGSSKAYAFLGSVYNDAGLYKEAIDACSKVRDFPLLSSISEAYHCMAYAYDKLGHPGESIEYYKKSLAINKDAEILYELGMVYIEKGDKKAALNCFEKALNIDKDLAQVYPPLIDIYRELGKEEEVGKLAKMYEDSKDKMEGEKYFEQGLNAYLKRDYLVAIEEFKKTLTLTPADPAPYCNLGYVYYDIGMLDKALEYQKKALSIDPNLAPAHYGLALIYGRLADKEGAIRHFKEYLRIEPAGHFSKIAKDEIIGLKK